MKLNEMNKFFPLRFRGCYWEFFPAFRKYDYEDCIGILQELRSEKQLVSPHVVSKITNPYFLQDACLYLFDPIRLAKPYSLGRKLVRYVQKEE